MSNLKALEDPHLDLPPYDTVRDIVGNPCAVDFTAFFNGNQFMVLNDLFQAFHQDFREYASIFYETLPPGLLAQQISHGGRLQLGTLTLQVFPDVFAAGDLEMQQLSSYLQTPLAYAQNRLALVIPQNNIAGITSLADLARDGIRILMPNPQTEGIARLALKALQMAGGDLPSRVFADKVREGDTVFTTVHHRETIDQVEREAYDVGIVWVSEAIHALIVGKAITWLPLPPDANPVGRYYIAGLKQAPHPEAQQHFLQFIATSTAQAIYSHYGFEAPDPQSALVGF